GRPAPPPGPRSTPGGPHAPASASPSPHPDRIVWFISPRWKPNPDVRTGRHVVHHLHAHLVFVTKYRREALTNAMLIRCDADSMRTDHAEGLCRLRGRTSRVQRRGRPRPPAGLLSTQGRLVQAGQLAEGGLGTDAAQGVRRPRPRALAG